MPVFKHGHPSTSILLDCTSKSHESSLAPSQAFLMANSLKRPLKVSTSHDASSLGNKRQREAQVLDGSNIVSEKIKAIEDLHDMATRQLREQAILRGLSSSGSKKELRDRLCAESEKESKNGTPESLCNFWPIIYTQENFIIRCSGLICLVLLALGRQRRRRRKRNKQQGRESYCEFQQGHCRAGSVSAWSYKDTVPCSRACKEHSTFICNV